MESLRQRLQLFERAMAALQEALALAPSVLVRDATIQRFEFTFEIAWKTARDFLRVHEGIDAGSPKSVIRECNGLGLLSDSEAIDALRMTDDRNLTSHTYDEAIANAIASRIPGHSMVLKAWLRRMLDSSSPAS